MNELVSMLVPLEGTLPGWPDAPEPTAMQVLGLLVGIPAVVFVIIALIGKSRSLISAGRGESDDSMDQPLWLGTAPADRAAITGAPAAGEGRRAAVEAAEPAIEVGGASARW